MIEMNHTIMNKIIPQGPRPNAFTMLAVALSLVAVVFIAESRAGNPSAIDSARVVADLGHSGETLRVYYFWRSGCPYCEAQTAFLDYLEQRYDVEILRFRVDYDRDRINIFREMGEVYRTRVGVVPHTFVGNRHWVGFDRRVAYQIEEHIRASLRDGWTDPFVE